MTPSLARAMGRILKVLPKDRVLNAPEYQFLYRRDSGAGPQGKVDLVILPESAEEVETVMAAAHDLGIAVTPRGAGLNLAGLTVPEAGGMVIDLRRMNRVVSVCTQRRLAVIEAGVTLGELARHLAVRCPELRFSAPDAPPSATVTGNVLFYGSGNLSVHGIHSEHLAGVEAILADGTRVRTGTLSGPNRVAGLNSGPDGTRWFINWLGTTGVVTRAAIRLFPVPSHRGISIYMLPRMDRVTEAFCALTETGLHEDLLLGHILPGKQMTTLALVYVIGEGEQAVAEKQAAIGTHLKNRPGAGLLPLPDGAFPDGVIKDFLSEFKDGRGTSALIDAKKGGGFVYLGVDLPVNRISRFLIPAFDAAKDLGFPAPVYTVRNVGAGSHAIVTIWFPFNRADPQDMALAETAVDRLTDIAQDVGGVPWKPAPHIQPKLVERLSETTRQTYAGVRHRMDPRGCMAPHNWNCFHGTRPDNRGDIC